MKSVRIWFIKDYECRYISHLDLNRCMLRALHKSKIPLWHTEGFNPHPFVTFALPLSLGFRGTNESMDIKLLEDDFSFEEIITRLNKCLPKGLQVFKVTEPIMKPGKIAFADFTMDISSDTENTSSLYLKVKNLFAMDEIQVEKKTKKGMKTIDIKPFIKKVDVIEKFDFVRIQFVLSAGSTNNVNPNLFVKALEEINSSSYNTNITRNNIFNEGMEVFE